MNSFLNNFKKKLKGKLPGKRNIHLDYAATTPVADEVQKAMMPFLSEKFFNPSSSYKEAQDIKKEIREHRKDVARMFQCKDSEVIFAQGGTESNNLAVLGLARHATEHFDFKPHMIFSEIEHPAIAECIPVLKRMGIDIDIVRVNEKGLLDLQDLEKKLTERTVLVSVIMVSNEIGTIQPLHKVSSVLKRYKNKLERPFHQYPFLHTDASQAILTEDIGISKLGADLISVDGSKIYAPKMTGLLIRKQHVPLEPIMYGGGQEFGLRSGTENAAGIVGLSAALRLVRTSREKDVMHFTKLRDTFLDALSKTGIQYELNGNPESCVSHIVNVCIRGLNSDFAVIQMDEMGVNCSAMTACASAKGIPKSQVIEAIGRSECAASSLRFSFGRSATAREVKKAVGILAEVCKKQLR
jgi:cysteine desulfurase